jgi:hypothetical protein
MGIVLKERKKAMDEQFYGFLQRFKLWYIPNKVLTILSLSKAVQVTYGSIVTSGCEFLTGCRRRKYAVETTALCTDFTFCKSGHCINFWG